MALYLFQKHNLSTASLPAITLLAILLFSPMFVLHEAGPIDFWWWMTINLSVLLALSFVADREFPSVLKQDFSTGLLKKTGIGILSALMLYLLFFVGNYLSRLWFDFAGPGIEGVYQFKGNAAGIRIAILMLLVIGPGEELFWRGFLQRKFSMKCGVRTGPVIALLLYSGIHIFTGNIMLIMAAFICGLFWAWIYLKYDSMAINVISHTVWDIAVFLALPFR